MCVCIIVKMLFFVLTRLFRKNKLGVCINVSKSKFLVFQFSKCIRTTRWYFKRLVKCFSFLVHSVIIKIKLKAVCFLKSNIVLLLNLRVRKRTIVLYYYYVIIMRLSRKIIVYQLYILCFDLFNYPR